MRPPAAFSALQGARRFEFWCLVGILAVALAMLGFFHLGAEITEGDTAAFDRRILLSLRNPADHAIPIGPVWLQGVARDITGLGGPAILSAVIFAIVGYLLVIRRGWTALMVGISVGSGSLLSTALKLAFERPRPELVPHAVAVYSGSFPSGHAMLSAVTYLTVGGLMMRMPVRSAAKIYVLAVAVLVSILVGISRIYLGVHWPTDVLGGWCVGAAWALLCWLVAAWLHNTRRPVF